MSGRTYDPHAVITEADAVIPRATIEKSRVRIDATGITVTHPLDDETRRRIEAAPTVLYREATGYAARGSVELTLTADQTDAFLRMIRNPWLRGCFHEGCDAADGEEGGSHWCRWAT